MSSCSGSRLLCRALERLGVEHIFGLPGTQNVDFFEELRQSTLRTIVPTHELAAGFMANGYYRSSGRPGVFTTIPGPGFAYVVAAIAEAQHDSAAVLYIVEQPELHPSRHFTLQAIDQYAILATLVKQTLVVSDTAEIPAAVHAAYNATLAGEPGPVLLHVSKKALAGFADDIETPPKLQLQAASSLQLEQAASRLAQAKRPLLYIGQGANSAAESVRLLAEFLKAPVVTTRSARGVIPEVHPLAMRFESNERGAKALNALVESSDLILAIGCKFSHNGSFGFRLQLPADRLIHVDASSQVLNANFPASLAICSDAAVFLTELLKDQRLGHSAWTPAQLAANAAQPISPASPEPSILGIRPGTPASFFAALRRAIPADAFLVTDTGSHQVLASRYYQVLRPRTFVIPSDFQSMGFGLPAAIAAKLANPNQRVVALIGDGGLLMSGMELRTAVRERIPITVIVFNDAAYGQIRMQQHSSYGHSIGTQLLPPNMELLASALGAKYLKFTHGESTLQQAIENDCVTILEVEVQDSLPMQIQRASGLGRSVARSLGAQHLKEMVQSLRKHLS